MPHKSTRHPRFDDLPDMCTVDEMRLFLRISRKTAYELVKSGAVRSVRFGKLIRIANGEILRLVSEHGHQTGSSTRRRTTRGNAA